MRVFQFCTFSVHLIFIMKQSSKKILFVQRVGPYGLSKPQETLDVILMASTFNQEVSLLFLDDGVFLLKTKQNPSSIGAKNFSAAYKALSLYGIEKVYVAADSLQQRALTPKDLMIPVTLLSTNEIIAILYGQDAIISS